MKRLLFFTVIFIASMSAMEQQQQQEAMVTVEFGDKDTGQFVSFLLPKKYAELSGLFKNYLEVPEGLDVQAIDVINLEYEKLKLFKAIQEHLPAAYEISLAEQDEVQALRNDLVSQLTKLNPENLGMLANGADFLDIPVLQEAALVACKDQLLNNSQLREKFLASKNPEAFNPFGLSDPLLVYLKEKIVVSPYFLSQDLQLGGVLPQWIYSLTFSPDGKTLASGSDDGTIKLWHQQDARWKQLLPLIGHRGKIISVTFSPDGKTLASGSDDKSIKLWQQQNGEWQVVQTLTGHTDTIWALAFSPDGLMLASGSSDETIKLWLQQNGQWKEAQSPFVGRFGTVWSLAFSPDGLMLALGAVDSAVRLWQRQENGQWDEVKSLTGDTGKIYSVVFSPDGKTLAFGFWDKKIELWQKQADGEWKMVQTLRGHTEMVRALAFSPDGKMLASGSSDETIKLWQQQKSEWEHTQTLRGYTSFGKWAMSAAFSESGSGTPGPGEVKSVAFSPNGTLASGNIFGTITLWGKFKTETLQEALLLAYTDQQVVAGRGPLDIAQYPSLQHLYQSLLAQNDKNSIDKFIIDSDSRDSRSHGTLDYVKGWLLGRFYNTEASSNNNNNNN